MNKKIVKHIMISLMIICSISFVYAEDTTTYMSCGGVKGIPYDIPGVVRTIIEFIKVGVPILLILIGSIDFFKAVIGDDKELNKATKKFTSRCISAVSVFFVILLVQLLLKMLGLGSSGMMECFTCFTSDGSYCATYEVAKVDYTSEIEAANKKREELAAKREEIRKKKEEEAKKQQQQQQQGTDIPPGGTKEIANALGLPYYNQCDSRWKNIQYDIGGGPNGTPATLCSSSCGYTSLSMVVAGLTKDSSINPYTMVKFLRGIKDGELTKRGYGAASFDEITSKKLSTYGIKATVISPSNIMKNLQAGKPVVILVPGHYMTLSISTSGKVVLLDPYTNWANSKKGPGEFNSVNDIANIYGSISWAAAYEKI